MPIRIILLDDHYLIRQGIRSILTNSLDIVIIGEGGSGEEFTQLVTTHQPDVVLLDLGMPQQANSSSRTPGNNFQPIHAIKWLARTYPATKVLVISQYIEPTIVEAAAEAGVGGYILKDDQLSRFLPDAIRAVRTGAVYLSEAVSRSLHETRQAPITDLTPRQIEILRAIVAQPNRSQAEHALAIGISEHTLHNHLRAIFDGLGLKNLTAAVVWAIECGLALPAGYSQNSLSPK